MDYNYIGRRIPRHDALQQVTGKIAYGEDLYRSGMLFAKALFSEYSHAEILNVDTSEAERLPGVKGVITSRDVHFNRYGLSHKDEPVLADDKVRFKGDAVAVVAAESLSIAKKAVKLIKVDYKPLKAVLDPFEGMKDETLIHEKTNIASHIKVRQGDVEKGFAQSDLIVEENFSTQKVEHCPMEPHVALAEIENDGRLVIWTSTSRPFSYTPSLSKILGLNMSQYKVKSPACGGSFGAKNEVTLEPWVAILAMKTKRPVKMVYTREEEIFTSTVRHPYWIKYKSGLKEDGTIMAREVELVSDNGPYVTLGEQTLTKAAVHAVGPYNVEHIKIDAYLVYTNTAVGGAMRGFGVPQVCFAYESHTDYLAKKLNMDPVEFRLKNMFGENAAMPTGQTLNSRPLKLSLERALELAGSVREGAGK